MADHHGPQEFENALKDVVSTKRASVSKMTRLNDAAKKCFEVRSSSSMAFFRYETDLSSSSPLFVLPDDPLANFPTPRTMRRWYPCYTVRTNLCNLSIRCLVCTHLTRWHVLLMAMPSSTGAQVKPSRATVPPSCLN